MGRRFVAILVREIAGVRQRECNSERFTGHPEASAHNGWTCGTRASGSTDTTDGLVDREYDTLVDDTENELLRRAGSGRRTNDDESAARQFNATVLSGRLRKAVRGLTNRDGGGVLQPDDACTKTGRAARSGCAP